MATTRRLQKVRTGRQHLVKSKISCLHKTKSEREFCNRSISHTKTALWLSWWIWEKNVNFHCRNSLISKHRDWNRFETSKSTIATFWYGQAWSIRWVKRVDKDNPPCLQREDMTHVFVDQPRKKSFSLQISQQFCRIIRPTTREPSELRSHSQRNTRSNHQKSASKLGSTIRISMRKVKFACQLSRPRTGSQRRRQTRWFMRSPHSSTIRSPSIRCALSSPRSFSKTARSSWRMPKSLHESTARSDTNRLKKI